MAIPTEAQTDPGDFPKLRPRPPRAFAENQEIPTEPASPPRQRLRRSGSETQSAPEEKSAMNFEMAPVREQAPDERRSAKPSRPGRRGGKPRTPFAFGPGMLLLVSLITALLSGGIFFEWGRHIGASKSETEWDAATAFQGESPSQAQKEELESALHDLQKGLVPEAKHTLSKLLEGNAPISSLAVLVGNAALLDGDVQLAEKAIRISLERGESVSDALMLQAIVEAKLASDPLHKPMGSPKVRIEGLLEQSISADASNPRPFFELATLRRFEKRHAEALELLNSASSRLGQSDSLMAVNLAIELVKLEQLDDAALRQWTPPGSDPQSLLCAAYAAMRLGEMARAADLLAQARAIIPPKSFSQLLKDPAFIPWRKDPALEKFFPQQNSN